MAEYEDYSSTSKVYDNTRRPIALDVIRSVFSDVARSQKKAVTDLHVLDAGCGTGNYTAALCGDVAKVVGLEYNAGMFARVTEKTKSLDQVQIVRGSIFDLPFKENSFDVVMVNQVLHHLTSGGEEMKIQLKKVFESFKRILRPGGAFVCNTQDPEQHIHGFWWAEIIPRAVKDLSLRLPEVTWMKKTLSEIGFQSIQHIIPPDTLMSFNQYKNLLGPFDKNFRDGDSTWSLATEEDLKKGLSWYKKTIVDTQQTQQYFAEREKIRAKYGQTTSIHNGKIRGRELLLLNLE